MKIKTGIVIPMTAATSVRVDQAERMAKKQKTTVCAQSDVDVPSPKLSQPSRPEDAQAKASSGERGSR